MAVRPTHAGHRAGHRATLLLLPTLVMTLPLLAVTGVLGQSPGPSLAPSSSATAPSPDASAAAPGTPVAPDPLVDGLLQSTDLPPGFAVATDVAEGTDYDLDTQAFNAHEGVRIVSRTWGQDSAAGTSIVFDFRLQFATPEAASAYLAAALPTLGETQTTGLTELTAPGPPAIGDELHVFGLDTQGDSGPVSIRDYIFRVGPVVAKVLGGGAGLAAAQMEAIARAAAARVTAAGPPAPGSPQPITSQAPSPTTAAPSIPAGDLGPLLLAHIPQAIAATCTPDSQRIWTGELVTMDCSPTDADITVTYSGFDSAEHMGAAYQASLDTIDLSDMADSCDLGTWSGSFQVDGADVGQITCWSEANGRAVMWSDDRLSILSVAVSPSLDPAGLYLWWQAAGPTP